MDDLTVPELDGLVKAHTLLEEALAAPERKPRALSVMVARSVLWHFGDTNLGIEPGGFEASLIRTISKADMSNLEKLRLGFPEHVEAVRAIQHEHWGLDWVRNRAREVA